MGSILKEGTGGEGGLLYLYQGENSFVVGCIGICQVIPALSLAATLKGWSEGSSGTDRRRCGILRAAKVNGGR
jgi:hypothetical protein